MVKPGNTCGTCFFGIRLVGTPRALICHGAPPTPVVTSIDEVKPYRPSVNLTDQGCTLWQTES